MEPIDELHSAIVRFKDFVNTHHDKVDNRQNMWRGTAEELLAIYGFHPVGSGKYASVFIKNGYPYAIKVFMKDTAYLKWLNFAKQHQNNPFVPKIRGKVLRVGNVFMAVRLEKLAPYNWADKAEDVFSKQVEAGNKYAIEVDKFIRKHEKMFDSHDGNFMLRGDQLVIIDPFFNWYRNNSFTIDPNDISGFDKLF